MDWRMPLIAAELDWLELSVSPHDRDDDPKFDSYEIDLYELLWTAWIEQLDELRKELPKDEYERYVALILGTLFATKVTPDVGKVLTKVYLLGRTEAAVEAGISVVWGKHDERAINFLREYTNFWIGSYYDRQLRETVTKIIREGLEEGLTTAQIGDRLQKIFSGQLDPDKLPRLAKGQYPWMYWRGLARNAITRARNVALISSFEQAGVKYYEIRAVRDGRTCPICRNMHGRVIPVELGRQNVDTFMRMRDPESVKRKFPWMKLGDALRPTQSLRLAHVLPPFHFNCRCTAVARFESIEEEAERFWKDPKYREEFSRRMLINAPSRVWEPETKEEALWMVKIARKEAFTKKEVREFLKNAEWAEGRFGEHLVGHARDFRRLMIFKGELTPERYRRIIGRAIRDGEVLGVIDGRTGFPQLWIIAEIEGDREHFIRVIVDIKGRRIKTAHPISRDRLEKAYRNLEVRYNVRGGRKKITLKALVVKMHWSREAVRDFAGAYFDIVSWAVRAAKRDGEIPYWDIESAFSHRSDVMKHFNLADDEAKEYLRKGDEIVLENLDIFVESGNVHYPSKPSLFWHEYLDWVKEGKLKVEWDDELGVYVGKLNK